MSHDIRPLRKGSVVHGAALRPITYCVMLACCELAAANPTGGQVAAGAATIVPSSKRLVVTNTPGTIINWNSFSIGRGEATRFVQQSASSAVLNRVVGQDVSSILGRLSSNGRVFLINPNGIVFGSHAIINTSGFIASTLNMSDQDFLAGKLRFEGGGLGALSNAGRIRASGDIVLVGPSIENSGLIHSDSGSVLLAAGKALTITSPDAHGITFKLQAPSDSVVNLGTIQAANAGAMFAGTLHHSGDVTVGSAHLDSAGRIVIVAQKDATIEAGSTLRANGAHGGDISVQSGDTTLVSGRIEALGTAGLGGNINILGNKVGLIDSASVDASGATGGGSVLVGGDFQGKNAEVPNAFRTYIGPNASIKADAGARGDGGKVIVWADDWTKFHGNISARGGSESGNGGFVETSGKQNLLFDGFVDVSAARGTAGKLLLDPANLNIVAGSGAPNDNALADSQVQFAEGGSADFTISNTALQANLTSADVILQATQDVNFQAAVNVTTGGHSLTAQAGQNINVSASVQTNGNILFSANDAGGPASGSGRVTIGAAVSSTALAPTIELRSNGSAAAHLLGGNLNAGGGTVTISGDALLTAPITINGNTAVNFNSPIAGGFDLTASSGGSVTFGAAVGNGVAPLASLTVAGGGTVNINGGSVATVGAQTYVNAVVLGADAALSSQNSNLQFNSTVNGGFGLTTTETGGATFSGAVGSTTALSSLTTNGSLVTFGGGSVRTSGAQTYNSAVQVSADTTFSSTGSGNITFGTLDAVSAGITVNTAGTTTFGGAVGASSAPTSLTTDNPGTTVIGAGITTSGSQTYNDAVTLAADATLTSSGSGGNITLASTVEGAHALATSTSGTTTFGGTVNVASITTDTAGTTSISPNVTITTSGNQTYNNPVTAPGATLNAGTSTITFASTVDTAAFLTLQANGILFNAGTDSVTGAGDIRLEPATVATSIGVGAGAAGTLNISQTDLDALAPTHNVFIGRSDGTGTTTLSAITFKGPTLTVQQPGLGGQIIVSGALTGAAGAGLALNASGGGGSGISLNNDITTLNEPMTLFGPVTLGAPVTLNAGVADISLVGTVDGGAALTLNSTGTMTLGGAVGATTPLSSLTLASGQAMINGGSVTTTGAQTYNGPVSGTSAATLRSTGSGAITFASTVDAIGLTIGTAGTITFSDIVGGTTPLASLTTESGGTTAINGGAITTVGPQTYNNAVTLGADTTLSSPNTFNTGNIALNNTVDGAQALTISTGGTVTFGAAVGASTALTSLTTTNGGPTAINGGSVTTTGAQLYNESVTLGADTTLTSTGGGAITLGNFLDGPHALTVNTAGLTTFGGNIGGNAPLASITTDTPGTTLMNASFVQTTGAQTYNDPVSAGGLALTTTGSGATITATNAANDFTGALSLNTSNGNASVVDVNALQLGGSNVGGNLTVLAGGSVTTVGSFASTNTIAFTGNASITATGASSNVTISNYITRNGSTAGTLDLRADAHVIFSNSAAVTASGAGGTLAVTLNSDRDASGSGGIVLNSGTVINSNGGSIILGGGANPLTTPAAGTSFGIVQGVLLDNAQLSSAGGAISIRGAGFATDAGHGVTIANGSVVQSTTGNIVIEGTGGSGSGTSNAGVEIANGATVRSTGPASGSIFITGTGAGRPGVELANGTNVVGDFAMTGDILLRSLSGTGIGLGAGSGDTANLTTGGTVTLNATGGGTVVQNSGAITAGGLRLLNDAAGTFTLNSVTNDVGTLAGGVNGDVSYTDANGVRVDTLQSRAIAGAAGQGTTSVGLSATGALNLTTVNSAGALVVVHDLAAGTTMNLNVAGELRLSDDGSVAATTGQTITAGTIVLNGNLPEAGGVDITNTSSGAQSISAGAGGIALNSTTAPAVINQQAFGVAQSITVNGGGSLTLTGGTVDGARASIQNSGNNQTISINGGGTLSLQGGSASSGAIAQIVSAGPQTFNFPNAGALTLTGGTTGTGNRADIRSDGAQTITGSPVLMMTGGSSGGTDGDGNSALIITGIGAQDFTFGAGTLTSGSGGIDNFASIQSPNQGITFNGNLTLNGSGGSTGAAGARIGGMRNDVTNLELSVTGNLLMSGGSTANGGAVLGPSALSTVTQPASISVAVDGNIVMNGGSAAPARIGQPASLVGGGSISVSAGGSITLNDGAGAGSFIRTADDVTLTAGTIQAGGAISESSGSAIQANSLSASARNGIGLTGNNIVTTFNGSNTTVNGIAFTESPGLQLTVSGVSQSGGRVSFTADDLNITGAINASDSVTLRPTTVARDINIEAGSTANSLSLTPGELQLITTTGALEIGRVADPSAGTLRVNAPIASSDINATQLSLFSRDVIVNALIGTSGVRFNHNLEVSAAQFARVNSGGAFTADDRSLSISGGAQGPGGGVTIGGAGSPVTLSVGSSSANTAAMLLGGNTISVSSTSGNVSLDVAGSGNQSFIAFGSLFFGTLGNSSVTVSTTNGTQSFTTFSGDMRVSAVGAPVAITAGANQIVSIGGVLDMQAGSATGASVRVSSVGPQTINASGIELIGGGGNGVVNAFAELRSNANQSFTVGADGVVLTGGSGGVNNFTAIDAPVQNIGVTGDVTLTGSAGGSGIADTRIGGLRNGATDLTLTVQGAVTLNGNASPGGGAAIGPSATSASAQTAAITVLASGDITLNGSAGAETRIGQPDGLVGSGNILIETGGNLVLGGSSTASSSIRTLGDVTVHADHPGKSILQVQNSTIAANTLTATADGAISLAGTNHVNNLNLTGGGGIAYSSAQPLSIDASTLTTGPGTQTIALSTTGAASDITLFGNSTSDDDIVIVSGRDVIVSGGSTFGANSATVNGAGALRFPGGTVTLNLPLTALMPLNISGATVNFNGGVTALHGLDLSSGVLQGAGVATISGGSFNWSGGTVAGAAPFVTHATSTTISGPAALSGRTWNNDSGTVDVTGAGRLTLASNAVINNQASGVWSVSGSDATPIAGSGSFINAGTFNNNGATAHATNVQFANTGRLAVNAGSLTLQTFPQNAGTLFVASGATLATGGAPLTNTGTIGGNGTIDLGGAVLTNKGNVAPGASPGTLVVNGDYTQTPDGTLTVEIGGTNPGTEYDVLNVTGTATLAGTLRIVPVNGYSPPAQQSFNIITYGNHSGNFNAVDPGYTTAPGPTSFGVTSSPGSGQGGAGGPQGGDTQMLLALPSNDVVTLNTQSLNTTTLSQEAMQVQQEGKAAETGDKRDLTRECK